MLIALHPMSVARRVHLKRGRYPYTIGLRTPIGPIHIELSSEQDLRTVNEVFFRQDYRLPRDVRVIVDFGSNIGVSVAYFLTRNTEVKVYAYEPVPTNIARAKRNLAVFADRVELVECAVGTVNGRVSFSVESSGRYGGIGLKGPKYKDSIEVTCWRAEEELRRILARHRRIDAIKIDVEGMEVPIIRSLSPEVLAATSRIMAECDGREVNLPNFAYKQYLSIARFDRCD